MQKILVIEDEPFVRSNILEILESGDFEAIGAENGKVGVHLALEHVPDLIVCDIMMPELDGYGVLTELRAIETTATIPFIFLTAKADKSDWRYGMNLGADDYITKPFRRSELLEAIATRLQKQTAAMNRYTTEKTRLIESLQQVEEQLNYLLHYDSLTNLPNLQLLRDRLSQSIVKASRHQKSVPIFSIDLDRFTRLNETLGHAIGNQLLQAVAHRLASYIGINDTLARLSADQFAIVLELSDRTLDVALFAQTILDALSQPFLVSDSLQDSCASSREVFLTACIGIALYPDDSHDAEALLQHADAALSHARQQGDNHYQFYTPRMNGQLSRVLALEGSLRYALERSEFLLYYQPKVSLQTGEITGAEVLLRWQHPELGFVSPAEFIPLAEQIGLIISMEEWVLQTVCAQLVAWNRAGLPLLRIAANLSGRQFQHPNLTERVVHILQNAGLAPEYLELELTERIVIQNVEENMTSLRELKALGIHISIDDFGTGYSSLNYLKQFPFDTLKIDQCFVRNIASDTKNAAITSAMIQMARSLNVKVIAEGVETHAELAFLCQSQCDEIQGYLFSRPVPLAEFEQMLKIGKRLQIL